MKFKQQYCQLQKGKKRKGKGREGKRKGEKNHVMGFFSWMHFHETMRLRNHKTPVRSTIQLFSSIRGKNLSGRKLQLLDIFSTAISLLQSLQEDEFAYQSLLNRKQFLILNYFITIF